MQITGMSPSASNKFVFCEQQYFIDYQLKIRSDDPTPQKKKALKGTIVHKILELLGKAKKNLDQGIKVVNDEIIGGDHQLDITKWIKESKLTKAGVEKVNSSRQDKKVYKDRKTCMLADGHTRKGVEFVEYVISLAYTWYTNVNSDYEWTDVDYHDIANWTWMILDYRDGEYDPRLKNILSTEFSFEVPIQKDWARYDYTLPDGTKKEGQLKLRGIIDLVLDQGDDIIEVVDWKTGERTDWSGNWPKQKNFEDLQKDTQLLIYYYALRTLYPNAKDIWLTIFFVRDGGPFTIPFDDASLLKIERYIRHQFETIKKTEIPTLLSHDQSHKKCSWCDYSKIIHNGQNLCAAVHQSIKNIGMDKTTIEFRTK